MSWLARHRNPLLAFLAGLIVFGAVAGTRLRRRSPDPHFVLQASAWLQGRLSIPTWPDRADDPARVEEVELDDGTLARGRRIGSRQTFRKFGGEEIPQARIRRTVQTIHHVSFPPFPAVLLIPQALVHGPIANDVALTVLLAALAPALLLVLLRRLREDGLSTRTPGDEVWLAILLSFGTVFFFCAVQGRVWFTAHVVGVNLAILYAWAAIGARRPLLAGLFLGLAFTTRAPMLFMAPLFLFEAWRAGREGVVRRLLLFSLPILVVGALAAVHNHARFGEFTEFGHRYLVVRQQAQIEREGLFSFTYLSRNLSVALTLLPRLEARAPWVSISGHGLAAWFTTPALLLLLWPRVRGPLHRSLWLTVLAVATPSLLYQNSGWVQFGYRFLLDYVVLLVLLLAVGGRPIGRGAKALIVAGVLINTLGALTFHRHHHVYRTDDATYNCVVPH